MSLDIDVLVRTVASVVVLLLASASVRGEPALEQAKRGAQSYAKRCGECHGLNLDGGQGPPLAGAHFHQAWQQKTARNLYSRILTTMPISDPGSLPSETVLDITVYILGENGISVGTEAMTSPDSLNALRIEH